ncbi:T6SS immunity protein Tdi1 domain-containing protein [Nocardia sp. NPDC052566]|uniref:T6SS immunity protein Tdi1 domain-containing protein n=1 Tax=Nocardia sp. NPDC052566 TaxID=3364330 RepID=UPI0037C6D763
MDDRGASGFRLVGPYQLADAMPEWEPHFPQFDTVFGYSDLGHVFLRNGRTRDYAILHPYIASAKDYGRFIEITDFVAEVLLDPGFAEYVLRPSHVAAIRELHGPLVDDEVYIAAPYPFLGGSERPDAYMRGDVWVFLDLVAQAQGL